MSLAFSLLRAIKTYGTENLFHTYFSEYYFLHNSVIFSDVFIHNLNNKDSATIKLTPNHRIGIKILGKVLAYI